MIVTTFSLAPIRFNNPRKQSELTGKTYDCLAPIRFNNPRKQDHQH